MTPQSDEHIRLQAINPTHSFIIQAPAGSGKTELLTQRYLNLLARAVNNPEEIIAITFTRKAANEMRERVLLALEFGATQPKPQEAYKIQTWQLAQAVLQRDKAKTWNLLENPNRLRILTIDALCAWLNAQVPLLSGFGAKANVTEDAKILYEQATFELIQNPGELHADITTLLLHVDNNATRLSELLISLLQKREQWLPHIMSHYRCPEELKTLLEQGLVNSVNDALAQANQLIPDADKEMLCHLACFAANELAKTSPHHPICQAKDLLNFPSPTVNHRAQWRAITELLLTTAGTFRSKVDKRCGFPAHEKTHKQKILSLLESYKENKDLLVALIDIRLAPSICYTDPQWKVIEALMNVLPILCAHLQVLFRNTESTDFAEITLRALNALGDEDNPTDLALYLDYQIKHLLVDEFQDTSVMQFNLLEKLTQGWETGEEKSLFLVGDPMQSIYRFRNAEVGLFLRACSHGIGSIALTPLTLSRNFRSQPPLVNWVNHSFEEIFPKQNDIHAGAISYTPSLCGVQKNADSSINYYTSPKQEVSQLVALIKQIQTTQPEDSIAILVKSRSHLTEIISSLNSAKINYQAIELEPLENYPEIMDLVSLTKALLHLSDRIAWLAILRAPWCGLTLSDLHALCQAAGKKPLWSVLVNFEQCANLSTDATERLAVLVPILTHALINQHQLPHSQFIKGVWQALQGPACLSSEQAHLNAKCYFELLEQLQHDFSLQALEDKLAKLFAKPDNGTNTSLQIMTIHKSKGLEFDHVILPELQRQPPADSDDLLMWQLTPNNSGSEDLIFAPIKAPHEPFDSIHRYLKLSEKQKLTLESARVFYVALTRAKKSLHLHCSLELDDNNDAKPPSKNSFLALLWPLYKNEFINAYLDASINSDHTASPTLLKRLPTNKLVNQPKLTLPPTDIGANLNQAEAVEFEKQKAATLGTVIHEALQLIADNPTSLNYKNQVYWHKRLKQLGLNNHALTKAVCTAIEKTLKDPKGQWILYNHHDSHSEYALTAEIKGTPRRLIIDRTFIDENNIRWIIDYKTATPRNESLTDFLTTQKALYLQQLHTYAAAFSALDSRPIKLGLYYPFCAAWVEWNYCSQQNLALNNQT